MDGLPESPELRAFLESLRHGAVLSGTVAAIERFGAFGAFVEIADGIEGLVPQRDLASPAVRVGDELTVLVSEVDRQRRRLLLSPAGLEHGSR
ncbi:MULTISPECIES: S1 RNA-binding domain-containing protein [Streptomycetaceae]|uniref:S1 RNA-binding domain-containing protein n=1 Tax=Streptomycetaceae TaxID=2062 RepID=UPI0009396E9A|nr:S1 RNA-binding domain-containing protein [Streptomyces sp. CB02056]OKH97967.1 hypothetical protein AMK13_36830 [Streptomyces sp. CB02056]